MKERPILFNGEMVRAILDGRKAQTRRAVKPQPPICSDGAVYNPSNYEPDKGWYWKPEGGFAKCPYGQPGDRLWVRETWRQFNAIDECGCSEAPCGCPRTGTVLYRASHDDGESKWRPSIHMPRWASRITLEITGVRVERLQDISEADAVAEGCLTNKQYQDAGGTEGLWPCDLCDGYQAHGSIGPNLGVTEVDCEACDSPEKRFEKLWISINGHDSWDANPWVWVIEFRCTDQEANS